MVKAALRSNRDIAARHYVRKLTRSSGSSFYWGMRLLPPEKREAMFAIYAFCRNVDDIADGEEAKEQKLLKLKHWRTSLDLIYSNPKNAHMTPVEHALSEAICRYSLQKKEFTDIISGMEMDAEGTMIAPSWERLQLYCDRVAGAVGLLSIRVFGDTSVKAQKFALVLGTALQLTNILRDLTTDARMGRMYLPEEQLVVHSIPKLLPKEMLAHPDIIKVCSAVATIALNKYLEADKISRGCDSHALRPSYVMMMQYRRLLQKLINHKWKNLEKPTRLTFAEKVWITVRHGFFSIDK